VEVVEQAACTEVAYYALESENTHGVAPHWVAAPAEVGPTGTSFDVFAGGAKCGRFAISLSGQHNVANALAALAACAQGYGAPLTSLVRPLAEFSGVKRRQELLGTPRGIRVYDDFAHHPTAVLKTLAGLRRRHPQGKLLALFEARSATACRKLHQADYVGAFAAADIVLLAPLGREGLSEGERLDTQKLAQDLVQAGKQAHAFGDLESLVESTKQYAANGDVVAVLSNGAFGGVQERLVAVLEG
jgi:UDP-N-acetylmuramate: L-alanyl-gamma-D-glutamyl-meso-diaminopimelate ligase